MYSPIDPESAGREFLTSESSGLSEVVESKATKASDRPEPSSDDFHIVGIGASAGGLQPLELFFANLPPQTEACFVVIQHLSPDFKSLMKELLERCAALPIYKVETGMVPYKNSIYLIPPGQNLVIRDRQFHLLSQERDTAAPVPQYPINLFFQSLAEDCGDRAIGIVLSGTGSDGTRGLQAINAAGGLTLVQDPSTAEFNGMPNHAIETRIIDQILSPAELAQSIARLVSSPQVIQDLRTESSKTRLAAPHLGQIIQILSDKEQVDFSFYKESTLSRRIHRRCLAAGFPSLSDYIQHLGRSEEERIMLKGDLLIKVSYFFRNPEAWSFLEKQVLPGLLELMGPQRPLRMWVAACATGEEAYSLAMLIHELADQIGRPVHAKIFATDLDQAALDRASQGIYPDTIRGDVSARFLHKYFEPRKHGFEIKRHIRKIVIFANHNLVQDAGFTRLDFVSCRNVLIYMQGQLQQKVLHGLNFSLRSNGILFLGESEILGNSENAFTTLDSRWRIYRKFRPIHLLNIPRANRQEHWLSSSRSTARQSASASALDPILEMTLRSLMTRRGATCLVVDRHNCLIHVAGGSANVLLVPEGRMSNNLAQRVVPSLRLPLNTAINRARRSGAKGASYRGILLREHESNQTVKLEVWPIFSDGPSNSPVGNANAEDLLIVLIEADHTESHSGETTVPVFEAGHEANHRIAEIEHELQQTRENLQATIEELETTNEEQQATNEELIASNEELQSTNEELHSVNEELYTVNSEYESKIQELLQLNSDIDNLLKSTEIGVIFLDKTLAIRKFTPAARAVIKLMATDVGRSIVDLSHSMVLADFSAMLKAVLANTQPESHEVELNDGRHMLMRLRPYQTTHDEVDGIVISFVEISHLKQTEQELRSAEQQLTANNEALERRVAERTSMLQNFSNHLQQLHISTSTYASEAELLMAYLRAGCSIFGLTTGSLICFEGDRLTLKAFCSSEFEQEIGQTFSHEVHCSEGLHCPWLPWSQHRSSVGYETVDSLELNEHPIYATSGIQSYLATKIQLEAENFGILEFAALAPREKGFERHELEILELIAAGIGNAMAREQAQRALIAQEAEYRKFYNETPVMLHSVDASGQLLSVSDYWLEKLGYARADVLGCPVMDFLTEESQHYAQCVVLPEFLKSGSSLDVPYQMVCRDGQVIDVLLSAIAERNPTGGLYRTLAVLVDVTESRRLQSELRQAQALANAKETAAIANRAKSRFLAGITHELRTPLNSVLGFSELLERDRSLGLEQIKQVETIRRAGKHLLSLINNVLDLSTLEAEQISPVYSHFDLHWLLEQEVWNLFHQQAGAKGLRFEILQAPAVPQYIYTDPVRLRQILINLVGNAIKFTRSGQVTLRVASIAAPDRVDEATPNSSEWLRFSVIDTGPGIPRSELPHLFEIFISSDRVPEGAGLGLSISYQLAHLLGGEIAVESQIGEGSTFTLTLPIERSDASQGHRAIDFREVVGLAPEQVVHRILVVEPDLDNQRFLVSLLDQVGFQVQAIGDGAKVVPIWERWQPNLVLIEIQLPNLDGAALVQQLKQMPQGQQTPVIVLTASTFQQHPAEVMATGCDGHLKKPVNSAEILTTIQHHLQVAYLYADSGQLMTLTEETEDVDQSLSVSQLSQLSTLWLDDFYQALGIGATVQMYQLIDQLPSEQSAIAIALERQISQYRFQALLELFAPLCQH